MIFKRRRPVTTRVFISYRRDDALPPATRLRDHLLARFPGAQIFMDLSAILPGENFPERIAETLRATDVVLVLIGPRWTGAGPPTGPRRIDDECDFVRIEVATALEIDAKVVPVLLENIPMPAPEHLPLDIAMIGRLNGPPLRSARFEADCEPILDVVRESAGAATARHPRRVPGELVGTWVSAGTGDAVLQYDVYPNGTYQFVGISRQTVSNGVFEFTVTHEGAVTVSGGSITFEAFRASASRRHPEYPTEDYDDQTRRPETTTFQWRLQPRGAERFLVLGDGATPAVGYRHIPRPQSPTRARQTPVDPLHP